MPNNKYYAKQLPKLGFGDFLRENAGIVGLVAGAGLGSIIPGVGTSIGATIGGAIGGGVQSKSEQDDLFSQQQDLANQQAQLIEDQREQAEFRNRLNLANRRFVNNRIQETNFAGTQRFQFGGMLKVDNKGIETPAESDIRDEIVTFPYETSEGRRFFPVKPTVDVIRDTSNFFPIGLGDHQEPIFATFNQELVDPATQYQVRVKNNRPVHSASLLRDLANMPVEESMLSVPRESIQFPGFRRGGNLTGDGLIQRGQDLVEFAGQRHEGPDGGIAVDKHANPVSISGGEPVALVEDGETAWTNPDTGEVYIFSDQLTS